MRPRLSVPLTALVLLVLIEAHRRLLASVILDAAAALAPPVRPFALLYAVVPLLLLTLPALPLPLGRDRRRLVAASAAVAALARIGAATPQSQGAGLAAALAMAAAATYLGAGVGLLARRAVAGGVALAFALDEVGRWILDPVALGSRPIRLAVPVIEAALILGLAVAAMGSEVEAGEGPERRAGGLRLRGALALGAILFLETGVLAAPAIAARRADLDRQLLAPALAAVSLGACAWLMAGGGPARLYRPRLVVMGATAGLAATLLGPLRGAAAAVLVVAGNLCALLLAGRALAPASGRRGTWTAAGALATLAALDGALALASAAPPELLSRGYPWVNGLAATVLVGALVLIPRPAPAPALLPRVFARVALAAGVVLGLILALASASIGVRIAAPSAADTTGTAPPRALRPAPTPRGRGVPGAQ